jgi:hypothetical protein
MFEYAVLRPTGDGRGSSAAEVESSLKVLCGVLGHTQQKGDEIAANKFSQISASLGVLDQMYARSDGQRWSSRPRIYALLCRIGALQYFDRFIERGISDIVLPFDWQTIGDIFEDDRIKQRFLDEQPLALTKARLLESKKEHLHFPGNASEQFSRLLYLDRGGYGTVDAAVSKLSGRLFARKSYPRGSDKEANRRAQLYLEEEINMLKRINHRHLVSIVGSYTDRRRIAYRMEPVADCNLDKYLQQQYQPAYDISLRQFFGCLAEAVQYLHSVKKIRHRDLNLRNIVVKSRTVYITDFGSALDFSGPRLSRTQDAHVPRTEGYQPPELVQNKERSSVSDMWSFGVVFLKMLSLFKGRRASDFRHYLRQHNRRDFEPCRNMEAVQAWINLLKTTHAAERKDNELVGWIKGLVIEQPPNRATAESLVTDVRQSPFAREFCCPECEAHEVLGFDDDGEQTVWGDEETDRSRINEQIRG